MHRYFPEEGRLVRIRRTRATVVLGIAGVEGFRQGYIDEFTWWFAAADNYLGDPKLGIPVGIPWDYVE